MIEEDMNNSLFIKKKYKSIRKKRQDIQVCFKRIK